MNRTETGMKIKVARVKKGWSQTALADRLHVSQATVALWESGNTFPKPNNLVELAELLDIPVDELLKVG
jgi:transcriptional regulator with XRE-family HTH domain